MNWILSSFCPYLQLKEEISRCWVISRVGHVGNGRVNWKPVTCYSKTQTLNNYTYYLAIIIVSNITIIHAISLSLQLLIIPFHLAYCKSFLIISPWLHSGPLPSQLQHCHQSNSLKTQLLSTWGSLLLFVAWLFSPQGTLCYGHCQACLSIPICSRTICSSSNVHEVLQLQSFTHLFPTLRFVVDTAVD